MRKISSKTFTLKCTLTVSGDKSQKDINWWVDRLLNTHKDDTLKHIVKEESPLKVTNLGVQKDPLLKSINMHKKLIKSALINFPRKIRVSGKIQQKFGGSKFVSIYLNTEGTLPNFICFDVLPEYYEVFFDYNYCTSDRHHQIRYSDPDLLTIIYNCVTECYTKCQKVTQ